MIEDRKTTREVDELYSLVPFGEQSVYLVENLYVCVNRQGVDNGVALGKKVCNGVCHVQAVVCDLGWGFMFAVLEANWRGGTQELVDGLQMSW